MKKCRTYLILCLLFVLSLGLVNSINDLYENKDNINNNASFTTNTNHLANEKFYTVSVQDDIFIESDTDYEILQNNKYKIKANSLISIFYKDSATTISSSDTININSTYLEHLGFYINNKFYDKNYFADNDIKINCNTSIKLAVKSYNLLGIGTFQNVTNNGVVSEDLINLLYINNSVVTTNSSLVNLISLEKDFEITSNLNSESSISNGHLLVDFENYKETKSICSFAIYQNSSDYKIVILDESNLDKSKDIELSLIYNTNFNNINEIKINFHKNLSYKNR